MRIDDDVRRAVVFFGIPDDTPGRGGIACFGTGFLLHYDGGRYLVTARHLTDGLADSPFVIRMNIRDGTSRNLYIDPSEVGPLWHYHPDETVDVAIMPLAITHEYDQLYLTDQMIVSPHKLDSDNIGIGDSTYVVRLFRLLHGARRNLPMVHSGSIALLPQDEKVPVRDWRNSTGTQTIQMEAYIVEGHGLQGLSGSPVFVRPSVGVRDVPLVSGPFAARLARLYIALLGIWQGSWDAPPDEVMAVEKGRGIRVPIGLGIVTPAARMIEVLESEDLKQNREQVKQSTARAAASQAVQPD